MTKEQIIKKISSHIDDYYPESYEGVFYGSDIDTIIDDIVNYIDYESVTHDTIRSLIDDGTLYEDTVVFRNPEAPDPDNSTLYLTAVGITTEQEDAEKWYTDIDNFYEGKKIIKELLADELDLISQQQIDEEEYIQKRQDNVNYAIDELKQLGYVYKHDEEYIQDVLDRWDSEHNPY